MNGHIHDLTIDELAEELVNVKSKINNLKTIQKDVEKALVNEMDIEGSKKTRTSSGLVTKYRRTEFDYSVLAELKEITDAQDLEGIYFPEHMAKVPEKWDMREGRHLADLSTRHKNIIDEARELGSENNVWRIKIDSKKGGE